MTTIRDNNLPIYLQKYSLRVLCHENSSEECGSIQYSTVGVLPSNLKEKRVWNLVGNGTLKKHSGEYILFYNFSKVDSSFAITFENKIDGLITVCGRVLDAFKYTSYSYDLSKKTLTITIDQSKWGFSVKRETEFSFDLQLNDSANTITSLVFDYFYDTDTQTTSSRKQTWDSSVYSGDKYIGTLTLNQESDGTNSVTSNLLIQWNSFTSLKNFSSDICSVLGGSGYNTCDQTSPNIKYCENLFTGEQPCLTYSLYPTPTPSPKPTSLTFREILPDSTGKISEGFYTSPNGNYYFQFDFQTGQNVLEIGDFTTGNTYVDPGWINDGNNSYELEFINGILTLYNTSLETPQSQYQTPTPPEGASSGQFIIDDNGNVYISNELFSGASVENIATMSPSPTPTSQVFDNTTTETPFVNPIASYIPYLLLFNNQQAEVDITGLDFIFGSTTIFQYSGEVTKIAPYQTVQFSFIDAAVLIQEYSIEFDSFAQMNSDGGGTDVKWTPTYYVTGNPPQAIVYGTLTLNNQSNQPIGAINSVTWNNYVESNSTEGKLCFSSGIGVDFSKVGDTPILQMVTWGLNPNSANYRSSTITSTNYTAFSPSMTIVDIGYPVIQNGENDIYFYSPNRKFAARLNTEGALDFSLMNGDGTINKIVFSSGTSSVPIKLQIDKGFPALGWENIFVWGTVSPDSDSFPYMVIDDMGNFYFTSSFDCASCETYFNSISYTVPAVAPEPATVYSITQTSNPVVSFPTLSVPGAGTNGGTISPGGFFYVEKILHWLDSCTQCEAKINWCDIAIEQTSLQNYTIGQPVSVSGCGKRQNLSSIYFPNISVPMAKTIDPGGVFLVDGNSTLHWLDSCTQCTNWYNWCDIVVDRFSLEGYTIGDPVSVWGCDNLPLIVQINSSVPKAGTNGTTVDPGGLFILNDGVLHWIDSCTQCGPSQPWCNHVYETLSNIGEYIVGKPLSEWGCENVPVVQFPSLSIPQADTVSAGGVFIVDDTNTIHYLDSDTQCGTNWGDIAVEKDSLDGYTVGAAVSSWGCGDVAYFPTLSVPGAGTNGGTISPGGFFYVEKVLHWLDSCSECSSNNWCDYASEELSLDNYTVGTAYADWVSPCPTCSPCPCTGVQNSNINNIFPFYLYIQNNQDNPLVIPFHSQFNFAFNTSLPSPYLSSTTTVCANGYSNLTIPTGEAVQVVFNYLPNIDNFFPSASVFSLPDGIPSNSSPIRWFQYIDSSSTQNFTNVPGSSSFDNTNIAITNISPPTASSNGIIDMTLNLQTMSSSIFIFYNNSTEPSPTYFTKSSCGQSLVITIKNNTYPKTFPYLVFIIPFVLANEDKTTYVDYIPYTVEKTSVDESGTLTITFDLSDGTSTVNS